MKKILILLLASIITLTTGCSNLNNTPAESKPQESISEEVPLVPITEMWQGKVFEAITKEDFTQQSNAIETNKEEKQAFYDKDYCEMELKLYGNTLEIFTQFEDGTMQYYKYITCEEGQLLLAFPQYQTDDTQISMETILYTKGNNVQSYTIFEYVKDGIAQNLTLKHKEFEAENKALINIEEQLTIAKKTQDSSLLYRREYIQTSEDGIDTIYCYSSDNLRHEVRVNPETGEIHYIAVYANNEMVGAFRFTNTDKLPSEPTEYTDNQQDIDYYSQNYLEEPKILFKK